MKEKWKYIAGAIIVLIIFVIVVVLNKEDTSLVNASNIDTKTTETVEEKKIHVDIKGCVKNPGVYEVDENTIVNDVIKLAGGLTKSAYTKNINLSKKTTDEMVIYIYSKKEMTTKTTQTTTLTNDAICKTEIINYDNCIKEKQDDNNSDLVNINTATKEELTTVSGIGASKADAIIAYREKTPFTKIEDIKNVSGIGDSLFAKIKEYITV